VIEFLELGRYRGLTALADGGGAENAGVENAGVEKAGVDLLPHLPVILM